jgi:hypothetical protein
MDESMPPDEQEINDLTVYNVGGGELQWIIEESPSGDCGTISDISWLSLSPTSGSTLAGTSSDVQVTFDSTGFGPGTNSGALCISSNDSSTPLVTVPVSMTVTSQFIFMPFLVAQ